ncbi:MAG: hypothetical protein ABI388_06475 [Bacteroidia bacterium]
MKTISPFIISFIFLVGINKQIVAQTVRRAEVKIEQKEITPVKEAPRAEAVAPPILHTEFVPAKEPEIRQETQTEVTPTFIPVEEPKVAPASQKAEWVKTEPEPVKPVANTNSGNNVAKRNLPVYNKEVKPMVRKATIKPFVLDTTKKP